MPDRADLPERERDLEKALRGIVAAHKRVIAAVTPKHPDSLLPRLSAEEAEAYEAVFSAWHRSVDDAAKLIGWDHRGEVAREAGTTNGVR
ncbi:MAG TPA: hypothetical protein VGN13_05570 [Solirubrobacteraceae bacterium]|jgi:hypothetical protein